MTNTDLDATYRELRPSLVAIAYRMLGGMTEAEDVVQEAFIRLQRQTSVELSDLESPAAYLTTVTTRIALDHLKSARATRETYVGPWLPEPLDAAAVTRVTVDPAGHAEMADNLSMGFLLMLETLSPVERAVFLLREVFGYDYDETARFVGKSPANCRQILTRARQHVAAARQRFDVDSVQRDELVGKFIAACETGDVDAFVQLLSADAVLNADGGGRVRAALRPVVGQHRVATFLARVMRYNVKGPLETALINGELGALWYEADGVHLASTISFDVADGLIQGIHMMRNPDKLVHYSA